MTYAGMVRAAEAARRREERDAQRALRDLEHRAREMEKLSALEQARLEVATYEKRLEVLLSVHKEQGCVWDWLRLASLLAPLRPRPTYSLEYKARRRALVLPPEQHENAERDITVARSEDERLFQEAAKAYEHEVAEWEKTTSLARRILSGEERAYVEALVDLSPLAELVDLGSSIHFTVHSAKLVGCELQVNGKQAIPAEQKVLTASGKVSTKAMPKARFHEIYQDYVCGCMLRVAREVLAVLPVDALLITALADVFDSRTGKTAEHPVLSAVMPRSVIYGLDFDRLDPSEALENFQHRGDFKASRKSELFQPIVPLLPSDIAKQNAGEAARSSELLAQAKALREDMRVTLSRMQPRTGVSVS